MSIIGICGREGAGKTSVCNYLCNKGDYVYFDCDNVEMYLLSTLFNWDYWELMLAYQTGENFNLFARDEIWSLSVEEARKTLLNIFRKTIDPDFKYPIGTFTLPEMYKIIKPNVDYKTYNFIEVSFAEPLKRITTAIFTFPEMENKVELLDTLLGVSDAARTKRENIKTIHYKIAGSLSGRRALEYLGSEVFKANFDKFIWVRLFQSKAKQLMSENIYPVISDCRFLIEKNVLEKMNTRFIIIFRNIKDLILTEEDKTTHSAKWEFLTFIGEIKNSVYIHNNGTLEDLYVKISNLFPLQNQP